MGFYSARSAKNRILRKFRTLALAICLVGIIPGCGGGRGGTGVSYSGDITRAGVGLPNVEVAVVNDRGETLFGSSDQNGTFQIYDPNSTKSAKIALTDGEEIGEFDLLLPDGTTAVQLQIVREAEDFVLSEVTFSGPGVTAAPTPAEDPIDSKEKSKEPSPPVINDENTPPDPKNEGKPSKKPTPTASPTPTSTPTPPPSGPGLSEGGQNPLAPLPPPEPTPTAEIPCEEDPACNTNIPDTIPPTDDGVTPPGGSSTLPGSGNSGVSVGAPGGVGVS